MSRLAVKRAFAAPASRKVSTDPWRAVIYIACRANTWTLALECGHLVCRHRSLPSSDVAAAVRAIFRPRIMVAPQRVRCWRCGAGIPTRDTSVAIAVCERIGVHP